MKDYFNNSLTLLFYKMKYILANPTKTKVEPIEKSAKGAF